MNSLNTVFRGISFQYFSDVSSAFVCWEFQIVTPRVITCLKYISRKPFWYLEFSDFFYFLIFRSIARSDLDFSYITSRLAVMSYPAEGLESAYRNHVEDVRALLDGRHPGHYVVYNVSGRSYSSTKFGTRVLDCGWHTRRAPPLHNLYSVCRNMYVFLGQDPKNVCVVHCLVSWKRVCKMIIIWRLERIMKKWNFCKNYGVTGIIICEDRSISHIA